MILKDNKFGMEEYISLLEDKKHSFWDGNNYIPFLESNDYCINFSLYREMSNIHPLLDEFCSSTIIINANNGKKCTVECTMSSFDTILQSLFVLTCHVGRSRNLKKGSYIIGPSQSWRSLTVGIHNMKK